MPKKQKKELPITEKLTIDLTDIERANLDEVAAYHGRLSVGAAVRMMIADWHRNISAVRVMVAGQVMADKVAGPITDERKNRYTASKETRTSLAYEAVDEVVPISPEYRRSPGPSPPPCRCRASGQSQTDPRRSERSDSAGGGGNAERAGSGSGGRRT